MADVRIQIPNQWRPRHYQRDAWRYLENGGKHAELIWHRRSGKDEICLHHAACAAMDRVAGYWHMLPEYSQARKAIWDAVNPHSGKRRIDEAFPKEIRKTTREDQMQIVFVNGSTWQVVGSDSYDRLVGSTPAGVVYSEWGLANPAAKAYLRPILAENNGWQLFITTPRGKNHAYNSFNSAKKDPRAFTQKLTADDTGIFSPEFLLTERQSYIDDFGEEQGDALFQQEYYCSFDAAILGAFYGHELRRMEQEGRITAVPYDPELLVNTAWDLGYSDDTSIWFYQVIRGEVHIIDCHSSHGHDIDYYIDLIQSRKYKYGIHWLPHDARAKTLASGGKSIQEMLAKAFKWENIRIVPSLSVMDGIQSARRMLKNAWIDDLKCNDGIEALSQYRREWDQDLKKFSDRPVHDFSSHYADAFRMMAIAWREDASKIEQDTKTRYPTDMTINELLEKRRRSRED